MVQYFPIVTGSLTVTGSVLVSGSITTNSTITATTLVVQTITSSISSITGSTNFGSLSSNTHTFTGSMNVTGALNLNGAASIIGALTTGNGLSAYTFGGGSAAAGGLTDKDITLKAWSPTSGTNEYGGDLILASGVGTGNASGKLGSVLIKVGTDGATGSTLGTYLTAATFSKYGIGVGVSNFGATLPSGTGWGYSSRRVIEVNSTDTNGNSAIFLRRSDLGTGLDLWSDNYFGDSYIDSRWDNASGNIYLRLRTAGTPVTAMTINGSGNIGIGTYGSTVKLYVRSPNATSSTYAFGCENGSVNLFLVRGDGLMQTGTASGSPYNNTSGAAANVVVNSSGTLERATSSLKYKRDIRNYDKGLAEVLQMRSVYYKGKNENDGDKQYAGLIAEEVHDLGLTEFVQYAEDGTPDALAYQNMIALLTKAIQELNTKFEDYKATHP